MTVHHTPVTSSVHPSTAAPVDPVVDPMVDRTADSTADSTQPEKALHDEAVRRLKEKADFRIHLVIYALVNGMLVIIWAMTGASFFWPVFPIAGWGIGLVAHAMDVYWKHDPTETEISSEMDRLRHR